MWNLTRRELLGVAAAGAGWAGFAPDAPATEKGPGSPRRDVDLSELHQRPGPRQAVQ